MNAREPQLPSDRPSDAVCIWSYGHEGRHENAKGETWHEAGLCGHDPAKALCSACATALDEGSYQRAIYDVAMWLEKRGDRWIDMAVVLGNKEAQKRQGAVACETKQIATALRSGKWKGMARGY